MVLRVIGLFVLVFVVAGCREQAPPPTDQSSSIQIDIQAESFAVGKTDLIVTVTDANAPINNATLSIRGDMSHAGMTPVIREVEPDEPITDGVYRVPFEWTMGGDWFVDVTATLPDGTGVTARADFTISSGS